MDWQKWLECIIVPLLYRQAQQTPLLPPPPTSSLSMDNSSSCSSTVSPPDRPLRDASGDNNASQTAPVQKNIRLTVNKSRYGQPPYTSTQPQTHDSPTDIKEPTHLTCRWNYCGHQFAKEDALAEHIKRDHIPQWHQDHPHSNWRCEWEGCDEKRQFTVLCKLFLHIKKHTGATRYECEVCELMKCHPGCGKEFSRKNNLKAHQRSHICDRPYKCEVPNCEMLFSNTNHRDRHTAMHSKPKEFACTIPGCSQSYSYRSSLGRHIKKVHGENQNKKAKESGPQYLSSCRRVDPSQEPGPSTANIPPKDFAQQQAEYSHDLQVQRTNIQQEHVGSLPNPFSPFSSLLLPRTLTTPPRLDLLTMNSLGLNPTTSFLPPFPPFQMPAVFPSPPQLLNPQPTKLKALLEQTPSAEEKDDEKKKTEDALSNRGSRENGESDRRVTRSFMIADIIQTASDSDDEIIEID